MTAFQTARRSLWYFTKPDVRGVQAIALTPEGRVVLVKHRYARGWHLPGGGHKKGEDARAAALRELREEIGLESHGEVRALGSFVYHPDHRRSTVTTFLVTDVSYRPGWSLEIEEVGEFDTSSLPPDTTAPSRERLAELRSLYGTIFFAVIPAEAGIPLPLREAGNREAGFPPSRE
jgi:8-oxo-dGTP pyrophosphatase MutT (NUDIX family)